MTSGMLVPVLITVAVYLVALTPPAAGLFNLFLSQTEVRKLMGEFCIILYPCRRESVENFTVYRVYFYLLFSRLLFVFNIRALRFTSNYIRGNAFILITKSGLFVCCYKWYDLVREVNSRCLFTCTARTHNVPWINPKLSSLNSRVWLLSRCFRGSQNNSKESRLFFFPEFSMQTWMQTSGTINVGAW